MNLSLPRDLSEFVEQQIKTGRYNSAEEVVKAGLERLQADERTSAEEIEELRREIAIGADQADRGDFVAFTADDIIAEGRRILEKKSKAG